MRLLHGLGAWVLLSAFATTNQPDRVVESMRNRIETAATLSRIKLGDEVIYASRSLPAFYRQRHFRLAWSTDQGPLPRAARLLQALRNAEQEGLDPGVYHLEKIGGLLREVQLDERMGKTLDPGRLVDLDLFLTDGFLVYASHLLSGRVNPMTFDTEWHVVESREVDFPSLLENALDSGDISSALSGLFPRNPGYRKAREALARYRQTLREGGWAQIPEGPKLQTGDQDDRVTILRRRLEVSGDLATENSDLPMLFDADLEQAVKRFQRRHGLDADGVVGKSTLAALNVSAKERVRQLELNLERWRWLPRELGETYILVNIPSFALEVVEGEILNGYRIGAYPRSPLKGLAIYRPPAGFIEVTERNQNTEIAPHFVLRQFLCKQESVYPKYLVLKERLVLKLELVLQEMNERGYRCETFHIMSGYRTPYYNKAIGNVRYSRHVWGGAADIFVDEDPKDEMMDDLNHDGTIDYRDAAVVYKVIDDLYGRPFYAPFLGGLARYRKTPAHGPFVHIDVRGFRARWDQ
jgi:hypothetical protein